MTEKGTNHEANQKSSRGDRQKARTLHRPIRPQTEFTVDDIKNTARRYRLWLRYYLYQSRQPTHCCPHGPRRRNWAFVLSATSRLKAAAAEAKALLAEKNIAQVEHPRPRHCCQLWLAALVCTVGCRRPQARS